ncbi:uncharacterized protein LOC121252014 isoform X1 [Juglans microcarpa x Juglans regia]|uniref:uncharacterized protein LOC121252014 isoform X1 n=1 Tax=Juglans microcarpa x Juglans regia TaxID=2249226 RepID=UPI001B7D9436|nr:uncharacterized protein LOC121252014 isoform X1 [Juglans microcarpa x Juglans regia]XP_041007396.1 uncharacterized protein LOC121252014 isoform X1 [Juglans microcarpa x Juglans regia]XP_041007397.1 uncharacterized protein LOC121252014 isoform X1 [Juglans microcarpa x Juglans regia]
MGNGDDGRCCFPLTSLQIGDLKSYLSDLSLFLACESKKSYILVDNQPWLRDPGSRRAQLWQLMVTKSRLSPFANTARRGRKEEKDSCCRPNTSKSDKLKKWFSLIDAVTLSHKRVLLPVKKLRESSLVSSELHRTLYGFIVFEVSWNNVRGINYLNELQTDTCLAIEAKVMQRWEFDTIAQAASSISSWFLGTLAEQLLLKKCLDSALGEVFFDAEENFSKAIPISDDDENVSNADLYVEDNCFHRLGGNYSPYFATDQNRSVLHTPPPLSEPYKRKEVMKSIRTGVEVDTYSEKIQDQVDDSSENSKTFSCDYKDAVEAPTQYMDVLILFRFIDRDLPFKLEQIIMSDLRLLTLLEAGLPSWVIFLQSYPGFCHLYRPWMCPLARVLYVLISVVTVLIGFYDLYKNVPVLKATAFRLCGPLLDWIETWEMVSRIKYLGTMLFLHNFQKAFKWFLTITHAARSFVLVFTRPLAQPLLGFMEFLLPVWSVFMEVMQSFCSVIWIVIGSSINLVENLVEILLLPICFSLSVIWSIATTILYPISWILWEMLYAPVRIILTSASFMAFISTGLYQMLGQMWQFVSSIFQLASASEATVSTYEVSMWRSLWNDLFSQVFRALRSILNGFVAFFSACNRHRLSIYNHIQEFIQRLFGQAHIIDHGVQNTGSTTSSGTLNPLRRKEENSH